jgi:hypothetical protein
VQPYRALWIVAMLTPSATLGMAWELWQQRRPGARLFGLALFAGLSMTAVSMPEAVWFLGALPIAFVALRRQGNDPFERWMNVLAGTVVMGATFWGLFRLTGFFLVVFPELPQLEPLLIYELVLSALGPGLLFAAALGITYALGRRLLEGRTVIVLALGTALWQTAFFSARHVALIDGYRNDVRLVTDYLQAHRGDRPITVYSNLCQLERVWIEWQARSYYDPCQTAGVCFARGTAIEANRRAPLVGPFELARLRERAILISDEFRAVFKAIHGLPFDSPPATREDLLRLARDTEVDYLTLWFMADAPFADLAVARGPGGVLVFDARALRSQVD